MSNLKDIAKLKEQVEELRTSKDKAQGALDACMDRLKETYDCDTLEEAQELLTVMEEDKAKAFKKYEAASEKFREEWDGKLST